MARRHDGMPAPTCGVVSGITARRHPELAQVNKTPTGTVVLSEAEVEACLASGEPDPGQPFPRQHCSYPAGGLRES